MDKLDIFQDSLAEAKPLASTLDAQNSEEQTFWVITSRAKGGANNPFGGSAEANQTSQLVQMTEQQLRQEYEDSGQLQQQFGSFDSYLGYVGESQEWIQTADWMLTTPEYRTGSKEWAFLNGEDLAWRPGEREQIQQQINQDIKNARTSGYQNWMNSEQGQALMQKYGIQDTIYNDDGDQFKWTGSGYQKTIKIDDHASFADYATAVLKSVVVSLATGAMTQAALGAFNVTGSDLLAKLPSGVKDFIRSNEILSGAVGAIADQLPGMVAGGVSGGGSLNNQIDGMFDSTWNNVIVNLANELGDQNGGGQNGIDNEDGTRRYSDWNLPEGYIYNEARNAVIHVASGEEYPVTVGMYSWYVNLPDLEEDDGGGGGGGGAQPAADTTDADGDGVPASQDPDDNNPNVPNAGGTVVNDTGEEVTTDGNEVDGNSAAVGAEHNWKYLGDGCFVKIDENGAEIPGTKVCDPDYTTGGYGAYQVGGVYSAGDDPFGTVSGDEGETVDPNNPEASYPDAGTNLGYECLPNGDKVVYTADGEGSATTEVVKGGCLEGQNGGFAGSVILGDGGDDSDSDGNVTGDSIGEVQTTSTSSIDGLCSGDRPEEYGFGQINYDKYCGDADGKGTEGTDGKGTEGTDGDGTKGTDGDGTEGTGGKGTEGTDDEGEGKELAAQGLLSGGYQGSLPVGFDYVLPQISPIFQSFQGDWAAALKGLEDRVTPMRSPLGGMFDEVI